MRNGHENGFSRTRAGRDTFPLVQQLQMDSFDFVVVALKEARRAERWLLLVGRLTNC